MLTLQHNKDELAERGEELYENEIKPNLDSGHEAQFIVIDVETSDYEINDDDFLATELLMERNPDAKTWITRVGHQVAYRIV